jgi:hypothetical protein
VTERNRATISHALLNGLCIAFTCSQSGIGQEFNLVTNGKASVEIIFANQASNYPIPAATQEKRFKECIEDFQQIINRISGAEFKATDSKDAGSISAENTIQVGMTAAALKAGVAERAAKLKLHGFLVHSDPENRVLYLVGSTLEGSGHALYEFLETLGCRWFMPGGFGEKLPSLKTITVKKVSLTREPEFELRAIQLRAKGAAASGTKTRAEVMDWMRRNKFGGTAPSRGHQFATMVPAKKYFEDHPEYFSLRNGKRQVTHLCMTNPATLAAAEAFLTDYFTKRPEATGYPVALADGRQYCECPPCTKACGGDATKIMTLYLKFTGKLFDSIEKKFPGREFQYGFYVYSNLMDVPEGRIPKQLAPYIAPLGYDAFHTTADPRRYLKLSVADKFSSETLARIKADTRSEPARKVHEVIKGWSNGTGNLYFRDYDPYVTFGQNMPLVRTYQLAIEIPWHKEIGVRGYTPEATANSWFTSGINFWVRCRYYWDTKADIKAVMEDYCKGMFGTAWDPMFGFLDALARQTMESPAFRHGDHVLTRLYSIEWVERLDVYLKRAESLAISESDKAGVQMWRLCQQHMLKYLLVRYAEQAGDFETAAVLGDDYLRFLDYISTVNNHFVDHRWYAEREFSMQTLVPQFRRQAAKLNGLEGKRITGLPTRWWFRHDPNDVGVKEGWHKFDAVAAYKPGKGQEVSISYPTMPGWQMQSTEKSWQTKYSDYEGYNWYRTQVFLPNSESGLGAPRREKGDGTKVRMFVTGIFGHMDFFINGQRVSWASRVKGKDGKVILEEVNHLDLGTAWSWNYNESFDVAIEKYLKPGELNTFAFRTRDKWKWGGVFKRAQLYTPLVDVPLPSGRPIKCDCSR